MRSVKLVFGNNTKQRIIDIGFLSIYKFDKLMCLLIQMKLERLFVIAFLLNTKDFHSKLL